MVLTIVLVASFVLAIAFVASYSVMSRKRSERRAAAHRTVQLVKGAFTIEPGDMSAYPLEVNPQMFSGHIAGRFRRDGDLRVVVVDELNFDRLRTQQTNVNTFYDSKIQSPGLIDIDLPTGRFDLVFINGLESFAPRTVFANVAYDWDVEPQQP
jgi:hypothetical protein